MTELTQDTAAAPQDLRAAARVFYDGACPVCQREIGWYSAMRGASRIDWVDVAPAQARLPEGFDREALLRRFTVVRADGAVVTGAAGFAALWRGLGPTRWLGRLCDRQPFLWLGERAYRVFLRLRRAWR